MLKEPKISNTKLTLVKGDVTDTDADAFVFYARNDLQLGSGYGTAITLRGGPGIKKELDAIGRVATGKAVATGAGEMKAKVIIHACGPKFQEEDEEKKLRDTMQSSLKCADEKGVKTLAFPPMGSGFYGIPLDMCRKVMIEEIRKHLEGKTCLEEVRIVVPDPREEGPFGEAIKSL